MNTIVFYSSNREKPDLQDKIAKNLIKASHGLPIISVTHKPMKLGINICVGEMEACNHNLFRQIQIGAKLATTSFIAHAEADCLYPPDYFQYMPKNINESYKCTNNYVLNEWGKGEYSGFYPKEFGTFSQITGREHLIREIDWVLRDRPFWDKKRTNERPIEIFRRRRWKLFDIDRPVVSVKTEQGMSKHTKIIEPPVDEIPYWGKADDLRKELFK